MRTSSTIAIIFIASLSSACFTARVQPKAQFSGSWAEDPARDREVRDFVDGVSSELLEPIPAEAVEVFVGKIPAGMKVEGGVVQVESGAPLEILGRASVTLSEGSAMGFAEYKDGWRKGYCYWQSPLTWVTLGLWTVVPLHYPCSIKRTAGKEEVLTATRNLVKKLGGDMFVGEYIFESEESASGMRGLVLRKLDARESDPPDSENLRTKI